MRILSGIQPSGKIHLGNYLGAIKQFVALQDQGEALFFIADWHALNTVHQGKQLESLSIDIALDFMALGLDPNKAVLFRQSQVPQHAELAWVLATVTPMALLERSHAYKDKLAHGQSANVGLFFYPLLMAADILLYGADVVPVGHDQKQHLEMARDIATKFNTLYAANYNPQAKTSKGCPASGQLTLPEPMILEQTQAVVGLDGKKMSKSYNNTLDLFMPEPQLKKKIMSMGTDSTPIEAPKPKDSPLLALLLALAPAQEHLRLTTSWMEGGVGYGTYKKELLGFFLDQFNEARRTRAELAADPTTVRRVLADGARRAAAISGPIWDGIAARIGCGRRYDEA